MVCLPVVMQLEGVFPLRELRGEHRDCWAQRAWVPGIWRCALLQDALPVIAVSATPVRRGVAFLMSSGGGALLATGYFLAAFQADALFWHFSGSFAAFPVCFGIAWRQGTDGDAFYSIITMSITTSVHHMSPRQGFDTAGRTVHGLAPRGYILPPRLGLNRRPQKNRKRGHSQ